LCLAGSEAKDLEKYFLFTGNLFGPFRDKKQLMCRYFVEMPLFRYQASGLKNAKIVPIAAPWQNF